MTANSSGCYRFGEFELQPDERRLLASGAAVRVGRNAFDVLLVLVERSGHLVTKDQLFERVWPNLVVEENTLQAHVSALRKILGPDAIATVAGRGYRFALEVTHVEAVPGPTPKNNLPHPSTSFIGREKQVSELKHLLGITRLLTLTGSGGCGKTRLAIQVAAEQLQRYPDGTSYVELADLATPALVPQAVATVLGAKEQVGKSLMHALATHVGTKRLLLILDNAEHVLGACAQLADALLRECEQLVILVTSRERLGIAGEHTYRVPSLAVPDTATGIDPVQIAAYESTRLFVDRARLQQPHFAVTAANAAAVAAICQRLDGIPMAIELAAPRVRSMSVDEVSRRIDQRFSLLTGGSRTALPRHRTLRALIDWSYDLLSAGEKAMLSRLSVFAGGCTLEASEKVCAGDGAGSGEVRDLLASLVDKHLLVADDNDGAPRYRLLETVRHYARDQLRESGDEANLQQRHLQWFLALADAFVAGLVQRANMEAWLDRLETEHDNVRCALAWSTSPGGDARGGLALAGKIFWFWSVRGYLSEGRGWLSTLLATAPGEQELAARAKALIGAGVIASQQGDDRAAQPLYEESVAIYKRVDYPAGISYALRSLGNLALARGDFTTARALKEESLVIERSLGTATTIGELLGVLGEVAGEQGDYPAANRHLQECLSIMRDLGDRWTVAWTYSRLGRVTHAQGDYLAAIVHFKEALTLIREFDSQWSMAAFLEGFAAAAVALAGPRRAARIWGGAERLREELGAPIAASDRARYTREITAARVAMDDNAAFDQAWQEGRAMTATQTLQYALDTEETGAYRSRSVSDG